MGANKRTAANDNKTAAKANKYNKVNESKKKERKVEAEMGMDMQ